MAKFLGPQFAGPFPLLGAPLFVSFFFGTFFLSRAMFSNCLHRSACATINFWLYGGTNYPSWLGAKTALRFIRRQSAGDANMVQKRQKGECTNFLFFPAFVCIFRRKLKHTLEHTHTCINSHTHTHTEQRASGREREHYQRQAANIRKTIMALLLTISASALWT